MADSPLEQLEKRLLEHPAARQFETQPIFGHDGVRLRVKYWSEKHHKNFDCYFELVGDNDIIDMLTTDAIERIASILDEEANDGLLRGPPDVIPG